MSQLKQNDDGDIDVTNNKFSLVDQREEVRQRLIQNLKTFFQEWFLDKGIGVPYHQVILQKGTPVSVIEATFKNEILQTKDVVNLTKFDPIDFDTGLRKLNINFEVMTVYGSISINEFAP